MNNHKAKTVVVSDSIMEAAASAIKAELVYQRATIRPPFVMNAARPSPLVMLEQAIRFPQKPRDFLV